MTLSAPAPKLDVRIPIGTSPSLVNRACLIALSLRDLGYDALVHATIGADRAPAEIEAQVARQLDAFGVSFSILSRERFLAWSKTANPHMATMSARFDASPMAADVLLLDADVLPIRRFDEFLASDPQTGADIVGVMAHASPFQDHRKTWDRLFDGFGIQKRLRSLEAEHSGWKIMEFDEQRRMSPFYFNTGVVLIAQDAFPNLGRTYQAALEFTHSLMNSYFADQIAFTLALYWLGCFVNVVSPKLNFPNDPGFDSRYPDDLADARFVHFLRSGVIDRDYDFSSVATMERLVARRDLQGSNEVLRERVEQLLPAFREKLLA